jgi:hypothetical protein
MSAITPSKAAVSTRLSAATALSLVKGGATGTSLVAVAVPAVAYVLVLLFCAAIGYWFALWFGIDLACVRYPSGNLCGLFGFFVSGPLGALLAVFLVSCLILFLPADVEPVPAGSTWKFPSASRLWRGQYSLVVSFWGFLILGTYVVVNTCGVINSFMLSLSAWFNWPAVLVYPYAVLIIFSPFVVLGYEVIAAVGVWRSANAIIAIRGEPSAKVLAAKIVVVLWFVSVVQQVLLFGSLGHWHIQH